MLTTVGYKRKTTHYLKYQKPAAFRTAAISEGALFPSSATDWIIRCFVFIRIPFVKQIVGFNVVALAFQYLYFRFARCSVMFPC